MRAYITLALLIAMVVAVAGPASATPPERLLPPQPADATFVVHNCGFDVELDLTGKSGEILFDDSAIVIGPGQTATLTNLDSDASTTVNISGSGRISVVENDDGSGTFTLVGTGNWILFNIDDPDDPIKLVSGRFTITEVFDADGTTISVDQDLSRARVVNLCEALA